MADRRTDVGHNEPIGWRPYVSVLVLALVLRVACALSTENTTSFDEGDYCALASSLLMGRGWTHPDDAYSTAVDLQPTSFFEPLYPAFLSGGAAG